MMIKTIVEHTECMSFHTSLYHNTFLDSIFLNIILDYFVLFLI
jgi:hypothetical protein